MYEILQTEISCLSQGRARLLAVSKLKPASAIRDLYERGQRAFGENYVQEALAKQQELADLGDIEWHLIGPLQSNKAALAALNFDWVQSIDRIKLVQALGKARPAAGKPLNILLQVNIDGEPGKAGCAPSELPALVAAVAAQPGLQLRGLMSIPRPDPDFAVRERAFTAMARLQAQLAQEHPHIDTLSMGMSEDFALALKCGATMVRIGTALFGARTDRNNTQPSADAILPTDRGGVRIEP